MKNLYKKGLSLILFLCMTLTISSGLKAQVSTYAFSQTAGVYTPIAGGILLGDAASDDQRFVDATVPLGGIGTTGVGLPIGFNFTFNGQVYDRVAINNNGWITFGSSLLTPSVNCNSSLSYSPLSGTSTATPAHLRNRVATLGRDLQGQVGSSLRIETIGVAPNQTCVIQWTNYRKFAATGDIFNFQIRLYQTVNVVETVYGAFTNNATNTLSQVGLGGTVNTDFNNRTTTTNWSATVAGAINSASCTASATVLPTSGTIYRWVAPPATPPVPFQVSPTTSCALGTNLDVLGVPALGDAWYWQTSANGTSLATEYSGPYNVFTNTTYYLRAYNSLTEAWSINSSSYPVTDVPSAPAPPAAVAASNPACAPVGTTISVDTAPVGTTYYWQGTTVNGTDTLLNASSTYPVTTTGTYQVSAYDSVSSCWSVTTPVTVTVDTYIPAAPSASVNNYNICAGGTTLPISLDPFATSGNVSLSFGTNLNSPGPATLFPVTVPALPSGATITSAQLLVTSVNAINGSYRSEARVGLSGMFTLAATQMSTLLSGGLITPDPVINLTSFPTTGGTLNLVLSETFDDGSFNTPNSIDATYGEVQLVINYTIPATTASWYDAATAGNTLGTGSPFETVGTSVLSNPTSFGTYEFYAGAVSGGCASSTRTLVTVNVANVNAVLSPVDATCNGGNNGSFTLGTVECGTLPFTYSVDGGAYGAIPTNLTAGTYSVVMMDNTGLMGSTISVVVAEPGAPTALAASNVLYFTADLSWTASGDETQYNVEYGPTGFTPGTGTSVLVSATTLSLSGLAAETCYDVYVSAVCGTNSLPATINFCTNSEFFTYDNACGPGFMDISSTGTIVDFSADPDFFTDDREAGLTLSYPINFNGATYTNMTIGANGGIILGTTTGEVGYTMVAPAPGTAGIYPFVEDLGDANDGIYTQVLGTAPNRQFVVMWSDVPPYGAADGFTFEVLFEEATNEVYFLYDDVNNTDGFVEDFGANAEIGVRSTVNIDVSLNNTTYLTNNSCVRFYTALCPNPVNIVSQVLIDEVNLTWSAGLYGETEWTVIYGPTGFDPATGGTTITTSSPSAAITGLSQLTTYDFYIYSECALDNLTSGGLLVTLQTLPLCSNPTGINTATAVDSLFTSWSWVETSAAYPSTGFNLQYGMTGFDLWTGTVVNADNNFTDTTANAAFLAGGVYEVYVQAVCGTDTSNYMGPFTFIMPLSNDSVCGAEMLQVDGTVYTFDNTGATAQPGESALITGSNPAGYNGTDLPMMTWGVPIVEGSNWYSFIAPPTGNLRFSGEDEAFFASQIAIYELTNCADFTSFSLVAASDQTDAAITTKVAPNFTICGLTPGNTYYVLHDAWSNGFGGAPIFGQYSIKMTPIVLQAGSVASMADVCTGDTTNLFTTITGNDANGVWTAVLASANTQVTDSLFVSSGLAYQIFDFEYRMTDGCAYDSIVSQVEIYDLSHAGNDGAFTVCKNEPVDLLSGLSGNVDLGGSWYDPSNNLMPSSSITASNIPGMFNYDYITGNGVCPEDTANVLVTVNPACDYLDIQEMFFGDMSLSPNPTNGLVYISNSGSSEVFNYEVTDVDGRVIATKLAAINGTTTTEVNLTGKVTGMYMIRVYNDNAMKVFRVILQ